MRRRNRIAIACGTAAATAAGIIVTALAPGASGSAQAAPDVLMARGADHLPSRSAADWTTYADHVVVVEAESQQVIPPTQRERDRGEGVIGRTVELKIQDVLWSREGAPKPAPATWNYSAMGWHFTGGDTGDRTKMALHDRPRVEVGHHYVMALRWEQARCSSDGETAPAQWRGLGEGSEIPYDDGTLGKGEQEGRAQDLQRARRAVSDAGPDRGLEEELAGRSADALVDALESAQPDPSAHARAEARAAKAACG